MTDLIVNGKVHAVDVEDDMPLLWALRDVLNLTGTKYGCGVAACGACTVHIDGVPTRSCSIPASAVAGQQIVTIEGLKTGDTLHKVQKAWIEAQAPQCGYCQSGQIMQAAALLARNSNPTREEVVAHMDGNLCRCMTYSRIQKAILRAAADIRTASNAGNERSPT